MPRWNISETRKLVEARYGRAQITLARHCLRSVTERLRHGQYHFQEARALLKSHIDDRLPSESIYTLAWPTDPEAWSDLDHCLMKVEAHMIACAQAVHSLADTLAHVVYYSLGLNSSPTELLEQVVSVDTVLEALATLSPARSAVAAPLASLRTDPAFVLVAAIVNHSKHRGFPESRLSIEPAHTEAPYAMEFGAFAYKKQQYAEREIAEALAPGYEAASRAVVDTGNAINHVLFQEAL